jgi:hypothetical protein
VKHASSWTDFRGPLSALSRYVSYDTILYCYAGSRVRAARGGETEPGDLDPAKSILIRIDPNKFFKIHAGVYIWIHIDPYKVVERRWNPTKYI